VNPYLPPDDPDLDNPYAPPRSTYVPAAAPLLAGGVPFTAGDVLNWSWAIFRERSVQCVALFWSVFGVAWGIDLAAELAVGPLFARAGRREALRVVLQVIVGLLWVLAPVWLNIGMNRGLLKIARREPVSFEILFTGGRSLRKVILGSIISGALIFLPPCVLVGSLVALSLTSGRLEPTFAVPFVVAGCVVAAMLCLNMMARLLQFYYLLVDRDMGVWESLARSWQITARRAATIIQVYMLQICVAIAGLLACCVGLIVALPLCSLISVVTYLALVEPARAVEKAPDPVWNDEL
jgi:hypothetical protein